MSMDSEQRSAPPDDVDQLGPGSGDLNLSPERVAFLRPRLKALLADFRQLEPMLRPEIEPAMTPDLEGYSRERN